MIGKHVVCDGRTVWPSTHSHATTIGERVVNWRLSPYTCGLVAAVVCKALAAAPTVSDVVASQQVGTNLVDVTYTLDDPSKASVVVSLTASTNSGATYDLACASVSGDAGIGIVTGANKHAVWNIGQDWPGSYTSNMCVCVVADDNVTNMPAPPGMATVPAGAFVMGNCMTNTEGQPRELPLHTVYISEFYMDKFLVTLEKWNDVYMWATNHGYSFQYYFAAKGTNHPVENVDWYDCVKWCNARSEKEGLAPCYYLDAATSVLYRTGESNIWNDCVRWTANGYRLPTEAEWEKAARGGTPGHRYPWADTDTISHSNANYTSGSYPYDMGPEAGPHPAYTNGAMPYTSPVGSFATNGYGLYDMAGNVYEWCWDWIDFDWYSNPGATNDDTRGPATWSPPFIWRLIRGGSWNNDADWTRTAFRVRYDPTYEFYNVGFRCARTGGAGVPAGKRATAQADSPEFIANTYVPDAPLNLAPTNGQGGIILQPELLSSPFSDPLDLHTASRWQLSTNALFAIVLVDSGETAANLTSYTPSGDLLPSTMYFWHVSHKDNHRQWSAWSAATSFETKNLEPPVVTAVTAQQRVGTNLVDVYYSLSDLDSPRLGVSMVASTNGGATFDYACVSVLGDTGYPVATGTNRYAVWNIGLDWPERYTSNMCIRVVAEDAMTNMPAPPGMTLVPASAFVMGNCMTNTEGWFQELPLHTVHISDFFMDKCMVTKELWDDVHMWATNHGYSFQNYFAAKGTNHPVENVDWYDCVKWCNARSEKEGLTPCYCLDAATSVVYRTGESNIWNECVRWTANGYRLPTEAEWEKAARGGTPGHRFPWTDADTISHSNANYTSSNDVYDIETVPGPDPAYTNGAMPFTSPVGSFAPNGYGLYDMSGNLLEWCWDWIDYHWYEGPGATNADTRGPATGVDRVLRGGSWDTDAFWQRCSFRVRYFPPYEFNNVGFRCVRSAGDDAPFAPLRARTTRAGKTTAAQADSPEFIANTYVPDAPLNLAPTNGQGSMLLQPELLSSPFSDPLDLHTASRWQISTTASFATVLVDSGETTTNLTSYTPDIALLPSTMYFWRASHKDNHGQWSAWSAATWFETMDMLPFVNITNADETVSYDATSATIGGTNNQQVTGNMVWTNSLTGGGGMLAAAADWTISDIGLAIGANVITVSGSNLWSQQTSDSVTITRGGIGTGAPFIDCDETNDPLAVYAPTNLIFTGTNNLQVVGDMWISNAVNGNVSNFPASLSWTSTPVAIELYTNVIYVFGTNMVGQTTNDTVMVFCMPEPALVGVLAALALLGRRRRTTA